MEKRNNNEIDLLLRSLGKGGRSDSSVDISHAAGNGAAGHHLDPDELNAFAEGVLPEAARMRYAAHLADCASCRGIVVNLSQAAGPTVARKATEVEPSRSVWQSLTALFSPQVLRYAVPVLALTAVIGISFIALRRNQSKDFVARHEPAQTAIPKVADSVEPSVAPPASTNRTESAPLPAEAKPSVPTERDAQWREQNPSDRKLLDSEVVAGLPAAKDAAAPPPPPVASAPASQPIYAPEPKPGNLAAGRAMPEISKKAEVMNQERAADTVTEKRARDDYKVAAKEGEDKNTAGLYTLRPSGPRRAQEANRPAAQSVAKSKSDADEERNEEQAQRSIAGRRFRRQGHAWIDTAYNPSQNTINVSRGSEQFRSLVADEPGIRTIANQLEGEVILVWKGKAYRIR